MQDSQLHSRFQALTCLTHLHLRKADNFPFLPASQLLAAPARPPLPGRALFSVHAGESPLLSRSGGEKGLRGSGAGTLGVPLGGTRLVGGLLGVAGRLSGTVSPFRAEQGTSLETPSQARASYCQAVGTTWLFSSRGGILELRRLLNCSFCHVVTLLAGEFLMSELEAQHLSCKRL